MLMINRKPTPGELNRERYEAIYERGIEYAESGRPWKRESFHRILAYSGEGYMFTRRGAYRNRVPVLTIDRLRLVNGHGQPITTFEFDPNDNEMGYITDRVDSNGALVTPFTLARQSRLSISPYDNSPDIALLPRFHAPLEEADVILAENLAAEAHRRLGSTAIVPAQTGE